MGVQEVEEKDPTAPEGKSDIVNETAWALPEVSVAAMVFEPAEPAVIEIFPELESV
jgi:hypothetical protein